MAARPLSTRSSIAYWCMDAMIFNLEALQAIKEGDRRRGVRCILLAKAAVKLAAGKIEGLDRCVPNPSGNNGGTFHE